MKIPGKLHVFIPLILLLFIFSCSKDSYSGSVIDGGEPDTDTPEMKISSGIYWHTCALLKDQTVKCLGSNGRSQLGDGTTTNSLVPVTVIDLST